MSFPCRLHQCLSDIEEMGKRDDKMKRMEKIFSWESDGRSFKIHSKQKFIDVIMPSFFPRIKYSSFVRQLHTFGFKRVPASDNTGALTGALYHELFQRGMPEMAKDIRKVDKNNKSSSSSSNTASKATVVPSGATMTKTSEAFLSSKVSTLSSSNQLPISKVMLSGDIVPVSRGSDSGSPLYTQTTCGSKSASCMTANTSYVGLLRSHGAGSGEGLAECLPSNHRQRSSPASSASSPSPARATPSPMLHGSPVLVIGGAPNNKKEDPPKDKKDFCLPPAFVFPVGHGGLEMTTTTEGHTALHNNRENRKEEQHEDNPFLGIKDFLQGMELLPSVESSHFFEPSFQELDLIFQEDL